MSVDGNTRVTFGNVMTSLIKPFWISVKFCKCASMDSNNGLIPTFVSDLAVSSDEAMFPVDKGRKLNVYKAFRRRPGRLLNVLCTFNLRPVSTGLY